MNIFEERYREYRASDTFRRNVQGFLLLKEVAVPNNTMVRNVSKKVEVLDYMVIYHEHLVLLQKETDKCSYAITIEVCVTKDDVLVKNVSVPLLIRKEIERQAVDEFVTLKSEKTLCAKYQVASPEDCIKVMPNFDKEREFTNLFWVKQEMKVTWDIMTYQEYIAVAPNASFVCNALPLGYWIDIMIKNFKIVSFAKDYIVFGKDQKLKVKSTSMYAYKLGQFIASNL